MEVETLNGRRFWEKEKMLQKQDSQKWQKLHNQQEEQHRKTLTLDPQSNPRPYLSHKLQDSIYGVEPEEEEELYQVPATFYVQNLYPQTSQTHSIHQFPQFYSPEATTKRQSHLLLPPPSASTPVDTRFEYARKMGTNQRKTSLPRLGTGKNGCAGEIVEVQGGHIVRSTGRKDRHSKVCTAKGPRDRRVRLSAHTAIQFYDVQDRLGYDRPSKAVDWLIKKAKSAIDELAELPAWDPHTATTLNTRTRSMQNHLNENSENPIGIIESRRAAMVENELFLQNLQRSEMEENPNYKGNSTFLPPSLHSDSISDTIKSFFPLGTSAMVGTPSTVPFQSCPTDFSSSNGRHSEDLQLSLQSLHGNGNEHVMFSATAPPIDGFDGWSEQQNHHPTAEITQFQRMFHWNSAETDTGNGNGSGEYVFSSSPQPTLPPSPPLLQPLFGESQFFSQRGPLQSSNMPFLRAFPVDLSPSDNQIPAYLHQPSFSSLGFGSGGFSGFLIPARIQGEKEHDGISDRPSSASSDSLH